MNPRHMIKVTGIEDLKRELNRLPDELNKRYRRMALMAGAAVIVNRAKELAPHRTGTLRRSIHAEPVEGAKSVAVGTNVEYAPYVEYGTSRMSARPYLRPAVDQTADQVTAEVRTVLAALLRKP